MARMYFEFENWVESANLACGEEKFRDLAKTYYLVGTLVTLLIILSATDFIGRKRGFYGVFVTICLGMLAAIAVPHYVIRMAALGVAMAAQPLLMSLYTIFFTETMRRVTLLQL